MAEKFSFPNSRIEFARLLKENNNCILTTVNYLQQNFELDFDKKSLESILFRIRDRVKKAKKSLDCLEGEWWHSNISTEPEVKRNRISDSLELPSDDEAEVATLSVTHRKTLDHLSMQQQRSRLSSVLESIKSLSLIENTSEIKIAALALQLLSNLTENRGIAKVSKSIVYDKFPGQFGNILKKELDVSKALFLVDMLEIGRRKYTNLHLLSSDIYFPAYHKVVEQRNSIILRNIIQLYPNPATPVGAHVPYAQYVRHTLDRILFTIPPPAAQDFPLRFQIADGLDGSGSHRIYNQSSTNTETKAYILFCFKAVQITTFSGRELWKNTSPNSPFTQRPIFLLAAKENENNIKQFMTDLINPETELMKNEGFSLGDNQQVHIDIVRSMFDGKMSAILSGAGGASCQLCTATHDELKDRELIIQGFPINRHITDAIQLFGEIEDNDSFLSLPSNERYNLTHEPTSTINILPASPLHSYTCIFRWFTLLVYHLSCGKLTWSPTSTAVKNSMVFVRTLVQEKTGLKIDQPDPKGGTTSTGGVARRAFSSESKFIDCVSSCVAIEYRETLSQLHTRLSAILRIINSDRKIHTEEFGDLCTNTYLLILDSFPWAGVTPTLHRVLAHSEEILNDLNFGHGLKCFSEEGSEACNKLIRKYRENLARKCSFEDNVVDIFVRLASESDPILNLFRSKLVCERCGEHGHTKRAKCCRNNSSLSSIDTIVDTLIINT